MQWERVYGQASADHLSWYQVHPAVSLELLAKAGVSAGDRVVDVGGGTSPLVDRLLELDVDVTVLDVAQTPLTTTAERLGDRATRVTWIVKDLMSWEPGQQYDVWHDRAVFHFLVEAADRYRYRQVLDRAVRPDGRLIVGTFAEDGPEACSGLPVARYSAEEFGREFPGFEVVERRREEHHTPRGSVQPFTWLLLRKQE